MDFLANFCLRGYLGAGGLTVEFTKSLHRAMFPPGYRQEITTRDGHKIWMMPREFKTVSNTVVTEYEKRALALSALTALIALGGFAYAGF